MRELRRLRGAFCFHLGQRLPHRLDVHLLALLRRPRVLQLTFELLVLSRDSPELLYLAKRAFGLVAEPQRHLTIEGVVCERKVRLQPLILTVKPLR